MVIVLSITANIYWVLKYFNLKTGQKHLQIFVVKHVLPSSGQNLKERLHSMPCIFYVALPDPHVYSNGAFK